MRCIPTIKQALTLKMLEDGLELLLENKRIYWKRDLFIIECNKGQKPGKELYFLGWMTKHGWLVKKSKKLDSGWVNYWEITSCGKEAIQRFDRDIDGK